MGDNGRIQEIVPDFYDFSLRPAPVDAQFGKDARHDGARGLGAQGSRPLQRRQVDASPLGKDALPRCHFPGTKRRDAARWKGQHCFVE